MGMTEDQVRVLLARPCARSRCVGGCVCADTWAEVNALRDARDGTVPDFDVSIPKDQRWVCSGCGKFCLPGEPRSRLGDAFCWMNAVLCWSDRTIEGWWEPVDPDVGAPASGCQSFRT